MKHERGQNDIEGPAAELVSQIADIALHHARPPAQSFVREPDHAGAAINGDHARSVPCQPIRVPARPTASVEDVLAAHVGQKGQRCGALVERVPRPFINLGRVTRGDRIVIRWTNHRRSLASGCAYTGSALGERLRLLALGWRWAVRPRASDCGALRKGALSSETRP